jgi:hypothetical protein
LAALDVPVDWGMKVSALDREDGRIVLLRRSMRMRGLLVLVSIGLW